MKPHGQKGHTVGTDMCSMDRFFQLQEDEEASRCRTQAMKRHSQRCDTTGTNLFSMDPLYQLSEEEEVSRVRSFFHGPEHAEPLPFPRNDTHSNRLISNEDAKYYLDDNWKVVHPDTVDRSPQGKTPFEHLQHRSSNVDVSPIEFDVDSDSISDTELQAAFDDIETVAREDARPQGNAVAPFPVYAPSNMLALLLIVWKLFDARISREGRSRQRISMQRLPRL